VSEINYAPLNEADLKAAAEAKAKRRAEFAKLVTEAGMDPAQIDVTKVMDDQEQATMIAQMAKNRQAKELAGDLGRTALKERLKKSVAHHESTVKRTTMRHKKD